MKLTITICGLYLLSIAGCLSVMDVAEMPQPTANCCPNVAEKPIDTSRLDSQIVKIEQKLRALELRKAKKQTKKTKKP